MSKLAHAGAAAALALALFAAEARADAKTSKDLAIAKSIADEVAADSQKGKVDYPSAYYYEYPNPDDAKTFSPQAWQIVADACEKARVANNAPKESEQYGTDNPLAIDAIRSVRTFDHNFFSNYPDPAQYASRKPAMSDADWKLLGGEIDKNLKENFGTTDGHAIMAIKAIRSARRIGEAVDEGVFEGNFAHATPEGRQALEAELKKGAYTKAVPPLSPKADNPDYTWGSGVTRHMSSSEKCRTEALGSLGDPDLADAACGTHHQQDIRNMVDDQLKDPNSDFSKLRDRIRGQIGGGKGQARPAAPAPGATTALPPAGDDAPYGTDDPNARKFIDALREMARTRVPVDMMKVFPSGSALISDDGLAAVKCEADRLGIKISNLETYRAGLVDSLMHKLGMK